MTKLTHTTPDLSSGQTTSAEVIGIAGTGAASLVSMWVNVRQTFYSKLRKDVLKTQYDERTKLRTQLGDALENKEINGAEFKEKLAKINETAQARWDESLKGMGINNFSDRFNTLNKFEKAKTLAIGLTVFSVGVGALLTLRAQHRHNHAKPYYENAGYIAKIQQQEQADTSPAKR